MTEMRANMKYKRLCNLKHAGIDFEHSGENLAKDGAQIFSLNSQCLNKGTDCEGLKCLYAGGECDPFFDFRNPVHSDFLVHWMGRDIDDQYDPNWEKRNDPRLNQDIIKPYVDRLKNILQYGVWMTSSNNDQPLRYNGKIVKRPSFYRACFTELKLSEARVHAKRFGRLGIGVKRPFVMDRKGAPMVYFREEFGNWFFVPFENAGTGITLPPDPWWAYYLKSMNEGESNGGYLEYTNFQESEWRIIYSAEIEKKFGKIRGIIEAKDANFLSYLDNCKVPESKRPGYLLPFDQWFAFIIYPSLAVKVEVEANTEIQDLIEKIKPTIKVGHNIRKSAGYEVYSKPFGINLDACRNF